MTTAESAPASMAKPRKRDQQRVLTLVAWLSVLFASVAPFAGVFGGGAVWDDNRLLPKFGVVDGTSFFGLFSTPFLDRYYRPMVSASFWLDHQLWGTNFGLSHAVNILLHLGAALLLMRTLQKATGNLTLATLAGLLFAVQPAQVASTAWIGGRTDALATFFIACTAAALFAASRAERPGRWIALASLGFAAAVFSKEQCLLLALLPLIPLGAGSAGVRRAFWPMAAIAVGYVLLWMAIAPPQTVLPATADSLPARVGHAALYYAQLLLAPGPSALHTLTNESIVSAGWPTAILGLLFVAATLTLFVVLRKRSPMAGWWCALAILGLAPVLDILSTPSFVVAPYKLGPTGLGAAALMAIGLVALANRWSSAKGVVYAAAGLACAYCFGLASWSAYNWRSELSADQAIVAHDPSSLFARFNSAVVYMNHGHYDDSEPELEEILRRVLGPGYESLGAQQVLEKLRTDPAAGRAIDVSQGYRKTHEAWLARVYIRLAESQQANGDNVAASRSLEIGKTLNQAGEGTFKPHPNG